MRELDGQELLELVDGDRWRQERTRELVAACLSILPNLVSVGVAHGIALAHSGSLPDAAELRDVANFLHAVEATRLANGEG